MPTHILKGYVTCHATGNLVPKFVKQKSAVPTFALMEFQRTQTQQKRYDLSEADEQWVKDLKCMQKQTALQKAQAEHQLQEIIEDHEITTEVLLQRLDDVLDCSDEVHYLKKQLETAYENHKWLLEKEDEMLKARDAELNKATIDEAKKLREKSKQALKAYHD